jgi:hypothetical protein
MEKDTCAMLQQFLEYMETLHPNALRTGVACDASSKTQVREFLSTLRRFNENPETSGSFPFRFISTDDATLGLLTPAKIDQLLATVERAGLKRLFRREPLVSGRDVLFFSHAALPFVQTLEDNDIAHANLLANGIVTDAFAFIGLITAKQERLAQGCEALKAVLATKH